MWKIFKIDEISAQIIDQKDVKRCLQSQERPEMH